MIDCACGCGAKLEPFDNRNRPREFVWGHHNKHILERNKFRKGQKAAGTPFNRGHIPWNKGKEWEQMSGENNPAWRGGTSSNRSSRWTKEYKRLRKQALERDSHMCTQCNAVPPQVRLHMDHIMPWRDYPKLRFELSNVRILCWNCHTKTETYGYSKDQSH